MPRAGDTFLGFTLTEELGRGAFARVFLAEQESLSNRLVALKITRRPTREAQRLARLQHTNVVPVYSVHEAQSVQVICMPFLGRRTIADAIRAYHRDHPSRIPSGRRTSATRKTKTTAVSGSAGGSSPGQTSGRHPSPALEPDPSAAALIGDVTAVLRTVAALAAGLAHAHARGILHLDIKPANVLLADTGEPMLLDFNLSHDTAAPDRDIVGGTVQYMAPEQLADVRTRGRGGVDARTDLYSLGVLTYEMLTGSAPFPASSQRLTDFDALIADRRKLLPPASERNPAVTPAVDAILRKLLASNPDHRYQSADELREDLDLQLNHRPLKFAADRSVRERLRKWERRNPKLALRLVAGVLLAGAIGAAALAVRNAAVRAEAEAVGQARTTHAALSTLRLDLVLPDDQAARARGKDRAAELLGGYGLPDDQDWRKRPAFARIPRDEQPGVAADLGEILLLLAQTRWQEGKARPAAERKETAAQALKLTRAARGCFPADAPPPFLVRQEAELATAVGEARGPTAAGEPKTPQDHFLDAVELVAAGRYAAAVAPLEKTIAGEPDHAAAQLCLAICRHRLGQHVRALERYDAARVLIPADPRPYYFRGLVLVLERKHTPAETEFTRAIELAPNSAGYYRDRAIVRIELGKFREAEDDLSAGLARGGSAFQLRLLRARARESLHNPAGAEADRTAVRQSRPEQELDYLVRGWTRMETDPRAALEDFEAALGQNPRSIAALRNECRLRANQLNDLPGALAMADRLVEAYPEYAPARGTRAVILARLGRRDEAHQEAELARTLSDDPSVTYQVACVYARTSVLKPEDRSTALGLLRQAFRDGYQELRVFETDPDLDPLRKLPEFAAFLRATRELMK
jgi:serine/threonine protein kinase/Flp pilus assembly protein TadD